MHKQIDELLQRYIDEDLEQFEIIILEEHLSTCSSCRRTLNQLKLMDWDLKHQPNIEMPPELAACRKAAVKIHLENVKSAAIQKEAGQAWNPQKHIIQHTFSFVYYNPVNLTVARSFKKTASVIARAAGSRLKKRSSILSRIIPGQA